MEILYTLPLEKFIMILYTEDDILSDGNPTVNNSKYLLRINDP